MSGTDISRETPSNISRITKRECADISIIGGLVVGMSIIEDMP
jgi:hypothetical protein